MKYLKIANRLML